MIDKPANEPISAYGPGSAEKLSLKAKIAELKANRVDIPKETLKRDAFGRAVNSP